MIAYKIAKDNGVTLKVEHDVMDHFEQNPMTWENLGTMICWHKRHNLGNDHNYSEPEEFRQEFNDKNAIILPLYLYDHSGITMNTTGFSCGWDSGQVGFIFVSKEDVRKEYGVKRISPKLKARVIEYLKKEVEIYDNYITGEVYRVVVEKENEGEMEEVESCGGFYGDNFEINGLMDFLPNEYTHLVEKLEYNF